MHGIPHLFFEAFALLVIAILSPFLIYFSNRRARREQERIDRRILGKDLPED